MVPHAQLAHVVGRGLLENVAQEEAEGAPELKRELLAPVRHNLGGQPKMGVPRLEEGPRQGGRGGVGQGHSLSRAGGNGPTMST